MDQVSSSLFCPRLCFFFFQAEDGIRDLTVTGVQTCALPICFIDSRNAKEYALFGDVSFQLLPSLKATVGMRWFRDTATFHQVTDGFFFGGAQRDRKSVV